MLSGLRADPVLTIHRRLLWISCQPLIWRLPMQLFATFRWLSYGVWWNSFKCIKKITDEKLTEYNITRWHVWCDLIRLGCLHALSPYQYFQHKLYQKTQQALMFHFIYDHQQVHFHRYINNQCINHQVSMRLISDKYQFEQALRKISIPTVPSQYVDTKALKQDISLFFQRKTIFCKPNASSQSQDAFLLKYESQQNQYILQAIKGQLLDDYQTICNYLKGAIARHAGFLIQPFIMDHEQIKTNPMMTTTVRIITAKMLPTSKPVVIYLKFEIPSADHTYKPMPLHWELLDLDPNYQKKYPLYAEQREITPEIKDLLRLSQCYCIDAHDKLLDLRSVAFDIILSQEGPCILEANYNWHLAVLYQVLPDNPLHIDNKHPAAQWLRQLFF